MEITAKERAAKLVSERSHIWNGYSKLPSHSPLDHEIAATDIAAAIRGAVEAEREACAKAVDSFNDIRDFTLLSDAIRARGNPTAEVK